MAWKVKLFSEAQKDFEQLDGSVRKMVLKQLVKLEIDPFYGDVLGNKAVSSNGFPHFLSRGFKREDLKNGYTFSV
jgi:hypothetical protein